MTPRWVDAGADDLWEGDMREVAVEGRPVLVVSLSGGELRAYQGLCPHQQQPLVDGELEDEVITCAGHLWEFDARTGRGINPLGCQLAVYAITRRDGRFLVGAPGGEEEASLWR
jgi:toluene monooxygenase system ferredoxin subunit